MSNGRRARGRASTCAATLAFAAAAWFALGLTVGPVVSPARVSDAVTPTGIDQTISGSQHDRTPPRLRPEARPTVAHRGESVVFFTHADDTGGGVAAQACHVGRHPGATRSGVHTVTCWARDRVGNVAVGRTTYLVVGERGGAAADGPDGRA